MALAIDAELAAIGIDDHGGVVMRIARALEDTHRQHHAQLLREGREAPDRRVAVDLLGTLQEVCMLLDAEIVAVKQLLQQHELRALGGSLTHQPLGLVAVPRPVVFGGHLGDGGIENGHDVQSFNRATSRRNGSWSPSGSASSSSAKRWPA